MLTVEKTRKLKEFYASRPSSEREYEACGKKFIVTRRFAGGKSLSEVVLRLALSRADGELGHE